MGCLGLFVGLCMCGVEGTWSWCFCWGFLCVFLLGLFFGGECRGFLLVFLGDVLMGFYWWLRKSFVLGFRGIGGVWLLCVGGLGMCWGFVACPDVGEWR